MYTYVGSLLYNSSSPHIRSDFPPFQFNTTIFLSILHTFTTWNNRKCVERELQAHCNGKGGGMWDTDRSRLFVQAGHETTYGSKHFSLYSNLPKLARCEKI